jgi:hypothetical protein
MKQLSMVHRSLKRRAFLRGAALGTPIALGLPVLEYFLNGNGDAFAQDGAALPRRFGVFFWGNGRGVEQERWNPAATGAAWEPSPQLEPLAAYKQYINVVSGLKVKLGMSPQGHHRGSVGILSGWDFITQPAGGAPYRSTFAKKSIDQVVADHTAAMTPFRSIEIGISTRVNKVEGTTLQFLSHNGPDSGNPQEYDPVKLFDRIFAMGNGGGGAADPELSKKLAEMKTSVLDSVLADLHGLEQRVGARDKLRLQQHAENIRAIEKRLSGGGPGLSAECAMPTRPGALAANPDGEPFVERSAAMSSVLALALACDMARSFSIHFSGSASNPVLHPLDLTRGNHDISHDGAGGQDAIDRSTIFTMQQLGVFLGALMAGVEGDSNLLAQSAILVSSDTSDGAAHSVDDYPILVCGSAGGFFKRPGVHHRGNGESTSQVLLSLVRSMGIQATEFGGGDSHVTASCTPIEAA